MELEKEGHNERSKERGRHRDGETGADASRRQASRSQDRACQSMKPGSTGPLTRERLHSFFSDPGRRVRGFVGSRTGQRLVLNVPAGLEAL